MQGGFDLSWLRPLSAADRGEGETPMIGGHRGHHTALNIKNPKPGYRYWYEANNPNKLQKRVNEGWDFVRPEDPERWGATLPDWVQKDAGGIRAFQDVVLMRIPEDRYRVIRQEKAQTALAAREAVDQEFLDKGYTRQQQLADGRPVYYSRPTHGDYIREGAR